MKPAFDTTRLSTELRDDAHDLHLCLAELIATVPVHEHEGRPFYVGLAESLQPWRDQFWPALYGSQSPKIEGIERVAYAWEQQSWGNGHCYGKHGPEGLSTPSEIMFALYLLAEYPLLTSLARERIEAAKLDAGLAGISTRPGGPGLTGKPCRQANRGSCARVRSR